MLDWLERSAEASPIYRVAQSTLRNKNSFGSHGFRTWRLDISVMLRPLELVRIRTAFGLTDYPARLSRQPFSISRSARLFFTSSSPKRTCSRIPASAVCRFPEQIAFARFE